MAAKSEIIAIFNSGVGYYRLMVPYIFAASLLASFLWFSNNYLVPWSNKKRLAFENKYISHQMVVSNRNIHRKINDSIYVFFELYDNTEKQALKFSVEHFRENTLTYKIVSEKATFDTAKKEWTLFNFIERKYNKHSESLNKGPTTKILLDLNPQQFVKRWTYVEELTTPELQEKIDDLKEQGAEYVTAYQLELYRRSSTAFGVIILSVIGMTIASVKMRGGLGLHLVIGIAICSIFEVIQKFSVTFALNANLPAVIAVWMPNFVALIIGGFLVMRYQK
jgi:lipopolysaccharide export system permease protein